MGRAPIELWGGVECTVNRVGDRFFDQCARSGHDRRPEDLDLFAALGVRALRYPVLWERTAPDDRGALEGADWRWSDARLARLRELGLRPIAGLVHHGSGPRATSLVDPCFPEALARYARAVAERYPWVEDFTSVNEPLTTARFSGLYGHWYPHGRDGRTFARALLTQCRATVLAMRAIREVTPGARLVQTEDMGETFSAHRLRYQANHENQRRWLAFDLLAGRVDPHHPLWMYLLSVGVTERELGFFRDNPCLPDVVGINYYVTSDRYLDDRVEFYPAWRVGGNKRHTYADVEAVRVGGCEIVGHRAVLERAWRRYGVPVALTEVHLGGPREEQLRWLQEAVDGARAARDAGADVRAVTAWSLLGAYDWNSLVVRDAGHYESGVYDLRGAPGTPPRGTGLAAMLKDLAAGRPHAHPVLEVPGWWRRPERVLHAAPAPSSPRAAPATRSARPLLIVGSGALGVAFERVCAGRGLPARVLDRRSLDITDPASVTAALAEFTPWAVINAAGYRRVDEAERFPDACRHANTLGPAVLARACKGRGVRLVTFSSDLVFDGSRRRPYVESDPVAPLSVYGRTKVEAERWVLEQMPSALVVRTSALFGPWHARDYIAEVLRDLAASRPVRAPDTVVSPTYTPDLVNVCLDLLVDGADGVWHLANQGELSWAELARRGAAAVGLDAALVEECAAHALGFAAARPQYSALGSERGVLLPTLDEALHRFAHEREAPAEWSARCA